MKLFGNVDDAYLSRALYPPEYLTLQKVEGDRVGGSIQLRSILRGDRVACTE